MGLGRSYGDSCLNSRGTLVVMTNFRQVYDLIEPRGLSEQKLAYLSES